MFPWQAQVYDRDVANGCSAALTGGTLPPASPSPSAPSTLASSSSSPPPNGNTSSKAGSKFVAEDDEENNRVSTSSSEVKGKTNTFYQVLIDSRDCPFIVIIINVSKQIYLLNQNQPNSVPKLRR